MPDLILPAPLWRRLAALVYDGLLYLASLMAGVALATPIVAFFVAENARTPLHNFAILQLYGYGIGVIFFVWSWVRGGQTLGMRTWRLQLRRLDGSRLRWPVALVRFTCSYVVLGLALGIAQWLGSDLPPGKARVLNALSALPWAFLIHYLPCLLSSRGRSLSDLVAGTEMVSLPRAGKASSPV